MLYFPKEEATFLLPGPAGNIEVLATPVPVDKTSRSAVAVICHPHPLFAGTMHNKVVTTLMRVFRDLGLRTVRFNFRGVGKSEGAFAEGVGEADDLLAVIDWAKRTCPNDELWLAGFSFGAAISLRVAAEQNVAQLVSVAPPVTRFDIGELAHPACPWIVVQGEKDDIVIPSDVYAWVEALHPSPVLIKVPDADHFFHRKLLDLRDLLEKALAL